MCYSLYYTIDSCRRRIYNRLVSMPIRCQTPSGDFSSLDTALVLRNPRKSDNGIGHSSSKQHSSEITPSLCSSKNTPEALCNYSHTAGKFLKKAVCASPVREIKDEVLALAHSTKKTQKWRDPQKSTFNFYCWRVSCARTKMVKVFLRRICPLLIF